MRGLFETLREDSEYRHVMECVEKNEFPIQISGCVDSQNVHFIQTVSDENGSNNVIVTVDEQSARKMAEDIRLYDKNVFYYPAKDVMFFSEIYTYNYYGRSDGQTYAA